MSLLSANGLTWSQSILLANPGDSADNNYDYSGALVTVGGTGCRIRIASIWDLIYFQLDNLAAVAAAVANSPLIVGPIPAWARPNATIKINCQVNSGGVLTMGLMTIDNTGMVNIGPATAAGTTGNFVIATNCEQLDSIIVSYYIL